MFLHKWDEQFHALVAKNMMQDLFNPMLYKNELLINGAEHWTFSHIWLHKQPLFLWQMALSMKAFGVNEIALRLPNIIAHGFMAIMIYDMGKILKSELTGLIASVIFCYMRFPLKYAAGMDATDHNDYMFLIYVTASFWALFNYHQKNKVQYLVLIGVFAGCAIMIKWFTGFLVIGAWGSYVLFYQRKHLGKPIKAFLTALVIILPWQLYCYIKYKASYLEEISLNNQHVSKALDGHDGNWQFHFEQLKNLYAENNIIFFVIGVSLIFFLFNKSISSFHKYILLFSVLMVYLFFSLVQTKMPAFCIIVIPMILLTIVTTCIELLDKINPKKVRSVVCIVLVSQLLILFFSPSYFLKRHTVSYRPNEHDMQKNIYEKMVINELGKQIKGDKIIFLNSKGLALRLMFYLDCDATDKIPEKEIIEKLQGKAFKIAAFKPGLPQYILDNNKIIKL